MIRKVNSLNPFDKGFFGQNLLNAKKNMPQNVIPSKFKADSIDDLLKYFDEKMFKKVTLEKAPKTDMVVTGQSLTSKSNNIWGF